MVEATDVEMKAVDETSTSTPETEVKKDPDLLTVEGNASLSFALIKFRVRFRKLGSR
jgi:hypothetical protein